ncbi:arsenic resistance N-acetyltransferase ArsN2 [Rudaea sp.]|uniref:arsenic resistance N-acetyltransferase ArsN2 n=1 Tax=Rudaea sp. TaxID=2136325 RepID=UPI00321FAA47
MNREIVASATPANFRPIVDLVREAGLPIADITPEHLAHFFVARIDSRVVGTVGLEIHGTEALLRSLAVAPAQRGMQIGEALVEAIESYAETQSIGSLTLLTTTADQYFERLGYRRIDRVNASQSLQHTAEFARLCPASAVCMTKVLESHQSAEAHA